MLITRKPHLSGPALRAERPRPARLGPSGTTRWQWYFCALAGPFSHLVLLDGHALLAHWVLPADQYVTELLPGMWTQVPPATGLAVPAVHQAAARGTCLAIRQALALPAGALPADQLLLHLPAADAAQGYVLTQLRPGGAGWLLRKLTDPSQRNAK